MTTILVTGSAGFIGANLVMRLLKTPDQVGGEDGLTIVGLDNMNDYYDVSLKEYRLRQIDALYTTLASCPSSEVSSSCPAPTGHLEYKFVRGSIADKALVDSLFDRVVVPVPGSAVMPGSDRASRIQVRVRQYRR